MAIILVALGAGPVMSQKLIRFGAFAVFAVLMAACASKPQPVAQPELEVPQLRGTLPL